LFKDKDKILFFAGSGHLGGAEVSLLDLIRHFVVSEHYEVTVVVPDSGVELEQEIQKKFSEKVHVHYFEYPSSLKRLGRFSRLPTYLLTARDFIEYTNQVMAFIEKNSIDVFYANGIKPFLVGCRLKAQRSKTQKPLKLIWHLRDWLVGKKQFGLGILAKLYADRVVSNSMATAGQLLWGDASRQRPRIILNSIDTEKYKPIEKEVARGRLGLPSQKLIVGMVGMLAPWKGQEVFIRASHYFRGQEVLFCIAGDEIYSTDGHGMEKKRLEELSKNLQMKSQVKFLGHVNDVESVYNACDLIVHASVEPEPFGRCIAESMSCGIPVIATRAGGAVELNTKQGIPFYVPPGDETALAKAIEQILKNPNRMELGLKGREWILSHLDFNLKKDEFNSVIEEVLAA